MDRPLPGASRAAAHHDGLSVAPLAQRIDALLPQTQCTKCGFSGCRPYAEAIAEGAVDFNRCPPGGAAGIARLAELLERAARELDPACGVETPRSSAFIDESRCIGCTLCIQACPVDAIVGAPKQMHSVLIAQCTGCDLCVPACPVDCIDMIALRDLAQRGSEAARAEMDVAISGHAPRWRDRHTRRTARLAREREERDARMLVKAQGKLGMIAEMGDTPEAARKRAAVMAAIERARARIAR